MAECAGLSRFRPRRLGLRARITSTFALGALAAVACCSPAPPTWSLRQNAACANARRRCSRQTYVNADASMRDSLRSADPEVHPPAHVAADAGRLVPARAVRRPAGPPLTLEFGARRAARRAARRVVGGTARRACASRCEATPCSPSASRSSTSNASYFEIVSLEELQNTLNSIGWALARRRAPHHVARRVARRLGEPARGAPARGRGKGGAGDRRRPPRHPSRRHRRPRPRAADDIVQRDGRRAPGPHSSATPASRPTSATSCDRR